MIRTVIIEDEHLSARKLERMLGLVHDIQVINRIESVEEGLVYFQNEPHPDLIFSDIVLGDGLSFEIFEKIKINSFIIYTTAFDQYTLRAFKLNSIDYLLKPIIQEDLSKAIEKYKSFMPTKQFYNQLNFKELIKEDKPKLSRIVSKIGYKLKVISIDEVCCFYSENKIVYAQTEERSYPTDFTLEELENSLDAEHFFRVNRQFIISLKHIKNIHTSPYFKVELNIPSPEEIVVSRDRVKDFKVWLSQS